jgi:aspartyl-tRNA(Asn)/glutamyl-tRNA(Gln) amidotransferase subunit B
VGELRDILVATNVSDARMEEGSMRVDANVSVRRNGDDTYGTRCEIKNLNSLRSLGRAIEYEARRQVDLIDAGERVHQETRHWDEAVGLTRSGRSKEEAEDYRYFQEPDLVPLEPEDAMLAELAATMPPLPADRRTHLARATGAAPTDRAVVIAVARGLDELALAAVDAGGDPARVLNHVEHNLAVDGAASVDPTALATLTRMEIEGALTATQAKTVLAELVNGASDPVAVAAAKGFEAMDVSALESVVDEVIVANGDTWERFVGGEGKAGGFLTGQVMKATNGKADGKAVNAILQRRKGVSAR